VRNPPASFSGRMLLLNAGKCQPDFTALRSRKQQSSQYYIAVVERALCIIQSCSLLDDALQSRPCEKDVYYDMPPVTAVLGANHV
jgi:hypothetical protein